MKGRVLAVDPGSKHIGIAISDPFRMIATPLTVVLHKNLAEDCERISQICQANEINFIIVGAPYGEGDEVNPQTRHAQKIVERLREISGLPVELWDESGSTQAARRIKREMGANRARRSGHLDEHAAAAILQTYLDAHYGRNNEEKE